LKSTTQLPLTSRGWFRRIPSGCTNQTLAWVCQNHI